MSKAGTTGSCPIYCVPEGRLPDIKLELRHASWAAANGFNGKLGHLLALPGMTGQREGYLFGLGPEEGRPPLAMGLAAASLDAGLYEFRGEYGDPALAALGFALGAYRFSRYLKDAPAGTAEAVMPKGADRDEVIRLTEAAYLARDLVNTPANDLGPEAFEREVRSFAKKHKMSVRAVVGDALLKQNFPMIHAVGRAAAEAPRLLELNWGPEDAPKVTLVGKGVTFDTGGLDIKPASGMLLMKKDMGGAANILGLAHAIMDAGLTLRLKVLLPIVENAIAGNAFRPGDVLRSRNGMSVEIGNTDAEGRLILADVLAYADEETPDLVIDMATLTGAARVALGPELPPVYANRDDLARDLQVAGEAMGDPLWHMPLYRPYARLLASKLADVSHISAGPYAGSLTAALFLQKFVPQAKAWAHLDIFAWAPEARPGRPQGGTDQGIRAAYKVLKDRYA